MDAVSTAAHTEALAAYFETVATAPVGDGTDSPVVHRAVHEAVEAALSAEIGERVNAPVRPPRWSEQTVEGKAGTVGATLIIIALTAASVVLAVTGSVALLAVLRRALTGC